MTNVLIAASIRRVAARRQPSWLTMVVVSLATFGLHTETLASHVTILDNGPNSNRVNIVFLGDGYTTANIASGLYSTHINSMLDHMFNDGEAPYSQYRNFFNAHRINVVSSQSGADVPPLGIFRNTALDATYYYDGVTERLLYVNQTKADVALAVGLAGAGFTADVRPIAINDTRYGGGGGKYATYAGGNSSATEVALHEIGHSFNGLADEYGGTGTYSGGEPSEVNVTKDSTGAKWSHWLGYDQPGIGVIGAYEGARYFDNGLYRPSINSKMRSLGRPFDAVSREKIILDIYDIVDPLDSWRENSSLISEVDPMLFIDAIDSSIISVEWYVDGNLIDGATGEAFSLTDFGFTSGLYTVMARAFDPTDWVRIHREKLEQSVSWQVQVVPEPATLVLLVIAAMSISIVRLRSSRLAHHP
jgi:hypothetical protein